LKLAVQRPSVTLGEAKRSEVERFHTFPNGL